ncbi:MAG TPA: substrate-binding domain-containing protein [Bacteroidia bacterium]|nr:substrate-binding domain-containing protein [Bacteroidia bacterium]
MKPEPFIRFFSFLLFTLLLLSCRQDEKGAPIENTPTSGELRICYDEGLEKHARNQAFTFEGIYYRARLHLKASSNAQAIRALYQDSCELVFISRLLNIQEQKAFASQSYDPKYSLVAKTGLAFICNAQSTIKFLRLSQIDGLLHQSNNIQDSLGIETPVTLLIDKSNSSLAEYLKDSLMHGGLLPQYLNAMGSSTETINYVATHKNALALIDFAWLSDIDDSISIANRSAIRILPVETRFDKHRYEMPNQSSFKLNTYPFIRPVYVMRKTGDFTLAKGFESFVAGPKGQLIFLKQGLLPGRQGERSVHVNLESKEPGE